MYFTGMHFSLPDAQRIPDAEHISICVRPNCLGVLGDSPGSGACERIRDILVPDYNRALLVTTIVCGH